MRTVSPWRGLEISMSTKMSAKIVKHIFVGLIHLYETKNGVTNGLKRRFIPKVNGKIRKQNLHLT